MREASPFFFFTFKFNTKQLYHASWLGNEVDVVRWEMGWGGRSGVRGRELREINDRYNDWN
jgi:hypothetical protein